MTVLGVHLIGRANVAEPGAGMEHDIFFSISHTPDHSGTMPTEAAMFDHYFDQLRLADELGFGVAWVAQAHLSTETQKQNASPVVPHWPGEVGLCTDFPQLALESFRCTSRIDVGSAVLSILAAGGPIAQAERLANTLTHLERLDRGGTRRLHIGFASGRFEFMARPYGIIPRDEVEATSWPALRGQVFLEAASIFLRLLRGDVVSDASARPTVLTRDHFRSDEDWTAVQRAAMHRDGGSTPPKYVHIAPRYAFEEVRIVPKEAPLERLVLVAGTHDPEAQIELNGILPVRVFNLSITSPEVIDATHERMATCFHPDGGAWTRGHMPRTVFVFVNDEPDLSADEQSAAAKHEAEAALAAYWTALEGTLDPSKVARATNNALVGNVREVADQMLERFHPEDRIMAWFDFFNHDNERVKRNMRAYMEGVVPLVERALKGGRR